MAQRDFRNESLVAPIPDVDIDIHQNVVYKRTPDRELLMDFYVPRSPPEFVPIVIFLHGDSADPDVVRDAKDWGQFRGWSRLLVSQGISAVVFNRRSTDSMSRWQDSKSDIESALEFVRVNAAKYQLDANRVALFAFSAGGLWSIPALRSYGRGIKCLVLYYPRLGYPGLTEKEEQWLRVKGIDPGSLERFMASNQVKTVESVPPFLLVNAAKEHPSLVEAARMFVEEATTRGVPIRVEEHEQGQHGFDVRDANDRSRELIHQTLAFLRENLVP